MIEPSKVCISAEEYKRLIIATEVSAKKKELTDMLDLYHKRYNELDKQIEEKYKDQLDDSLKRIENLLCENKQHLNKIAQYETEIIKLKCKLKETNKNWFEKLFKL